jgi:enamine deaminase RidA (YjgF/YER057c/UK114 family)
MVNCTLEVDRRPAAANGCSDLLVEVFGERGRNARSADRMSSLQCDIRVEVEMVVEVAD